VAGGSDVRAELAAKWRARAAEYAERIGMPPASDGEVRADALDRGEPVEVAGWELPRGLLPRGAAPGAPYFYVIEPDGSVRPATERSPS
jgi:hypothetical protein